MNAELSFPIATPPVPAAVHEIAPGILWLRMRLPFALDHINLWLLADGPGWTVVDTGYATDDAKAAWRHIFAEHLGGRPVTRVLVTHYHPDHIGLADWIGEQWDAPLWITEKEWLHARMLTGGGGADLEPLRREFAHRAGLDDAASALFAERHNGYRRGVPSVAPRFHRLADGMTVPIGERQWRVIVGEGHAPELACLYCAEDGILISGDQILPKISPNISLQAHEPDGNPLAAFLGSLDKLREAVAPDVLVLPSHNLPFYGLHSRIDALAAHHEERCGALLTACTTPQTIVDLLPVLFRRTLDSHQIVFALGEAMAHTSFLVSAGTLACGRGADGVDRFLLRAA